MPALSLALVWTAPAAALPSPGDGCTPNPPPDVTLLGPHARASFGQALAGADFDADGWSDLVVGVPDFGPVPGGIEVFRGTATGLDPTPIVVTGVGEYELWGSDLAVAGDVDADGWTDLVLGSQDAEEVWILAGGPAGIATSPSWVATTPHPTDPIGGQVDGGRDVDGDGIDDVLYAADQLVEGEALWLWRGGVGGPGVPSALVLADPEVPTVSIGGDLDGDGRADPVGSAIERIRIWPGGEPEVNVPLADRGASNRWVALGDSDGDGLDDLATLSSTGDGRVWLVHGSGTAWIDPVGYIEPDRGETFRVVHATGDFDDDGAVEVGVVLERRNGATNWLEWTAVYEARADGFDPAPDRVFASGEVGCGAGPAAAVGDVNGDGVTDLALGGPSIDSLAGEASGRVFLYFGWQDDAAPSTPTGGTTTTTPTVSQDPGPSGSEPAASRGPAGADRGCGCASPPGEVGGGILLVVAAVLTRRQGR